MCNIICCFQPPPFQDFSSNASTENLETAENWVVTKPKKKSKKRRNSISSGARRQNSTSESTKQPTNRAPSPDLRGNTTRSVPHSEKSNDSSDVDSVHSLPIDDLNMPISYADIAKNSEKLKEKKTSPEKVDNKVATKEKFPALKVDQEPKIQQNSKKSPHIEKNSPMEKSTSPHPTLTISKITPPDVNNMKNFPAISADNSKNTTPITPTTKHQDLQDVPDKHIPETKIHPIQDISVDVQQQQQTPKTTNVTPSVDIANTKNLPSETSHHQIPKIVPETVCVKNMPPDVHNIRNFPAMPNINKNLNVSEKNSNNTKNNFAPPISNKIRNILPANNNGKSSKSGHINNNNNKLKSSARNASTNAVHNDIQNDLTVSILRFKVEIRLIVSYLDWFVFLFKLKGFAL